MFAASKTFAEITGAGAHRLDQAGAPKPYRPSLQAQFKQDVLALLQSALTLQLTSVDSEGWPTSGGGYFVTIATGEFQPVVYLFTSAGSAELRNIAADPRVSFTLFRAISFERRRETKAVQVQGVASVVTVAGERAAALAAAAERGDDFVAALGVNPEIIRIEAATATFSSMSARPQWGLIDYAPAPQSDAQREAAARGHIEAVVSKMTTLPGGVVDIAFNAADGRALPDYPPGSHIQVFVRDDLVRPYSLREAPTGDGAYRIGVLREQHSRGGSEIICTQWKPGQKVRISAPRNFFPLDRAAGKIFLIGGGVGVTPLVAMADFLHARGLDFELHYCFRSDERAAFKPILEAKPYAAKLHLHASGDRRFDFAKDVGPGAPESHIYVCGPPGFMDYVLSEARRAGFGDRQLHSELFGGEADTAGEPFTVTVDDGRSFEVPPGKTIAQVLLSEGYHIEMACERGICGSCVAEVREGQPDHRDHFLTDLEKMSNDQMALCCSRAKTPNLKIVLAT